jgi:hypothetical protein
MKEQKYDRQGFPIKVDGLEAYNSHKSPSKENQQTDKPRKSHL